MKKKLVLKKEVIAMLDNEAMRVQKGGVENRTLTLPGGCCLWDINETAACRGASADCGSLTAQTDAYCATLNGAAWCEPGFSVKPEVGCPGTIGCNF